MTRRRVRAGHVSILAHVVGTAGGDATAREITQPPAHVDLAHWQCRDITTVPTTPSGACSRWPLAGLAPCARRCAGCHAGNREGQAANRLATDDHPATGGPEAWLQLALFLESVQIGSCGWSTPCEPHRRSPDLAPEAAPDRATIRARIRAAAAKPPRTSYAVIAHCASGSRVAGYAGADALCGSAFRDNSRDERGSERYDARAWFATPLVHAPNVCGGIGHRADCRNGVCAARRVWMSNTGVIMASLP